MRKVKEVLRLRFELRFGQRQIARSCRMGLSTVHEYLERAEAAGVGWPLPEDWSEEELEAKLFGQQPVSPRAVKQRPQPDWKTSFFAMPRKPMPSLCNLWAALASTCTALRPSCFPALRARCSPALVRSEIEMRSCSANVAIIEMTTSRIIPQESKNGTRSDLRTPP